jgi:hypothetical protein
MLDWIILIPCELNNTSGWTTSDVTDYFYAPSIYIRAKSLSAKWLGGLVVSRSALDALEGREICCLEPSSDSLVVQPLAAQYTSRAIPYTVQNLTIIYRKSFPQQVMTTQRGGDRMFGFHTYRDIRHN